jgi:hypothetical protein
VNENEDETEVASIPIWNLEIADIKLLEKTAHFSTHLRF